MPILGEGASRDKRVSMLAKTMGGCQLLAVMHHILQTIRSIQACPTCSVAKGLFAGLVSSRYDYCACYIYTVCNANVGLVWLLICNVKLVGRYLRVVSFPVGSS